MTGMMQGDCYQIGVQILNNAGSLVTPAEVDDVEITAGHLRKTHKEGQLRFHEGVWLFPLSQQESFRYRTAAPRAQVRVKWKDGSIEGASLYGLRFQESISKEVL